MTTDQDYFALFGLERGFHVDLRQLADRFRELQRQHHPDRFAADSAEKQLEAVRYSALLNDAFSTLRDPLRRAVYLLRLAGVEMTEDQRHKLAPEFLLEQMQLREELESIAEAGDQERLDDFAERIARRRKSVEAAFVEALESTRPADLKSAVARVQELQFIDKLQQEIELIEERLTED